MFTHHQRRTASTAGAYRSRRYETTWSGTCLSGQRGTSTLVACLNSQRCPVARQIAMTKRFPTHRSTELALPVSLLCRCDRYGMPPGRSARLRRTRYPRHVPSERKTTVYCGRPRRERPQGMTHAVIVAVRVPTAVRSPVTTRTLADRGTRRHAPGRPQ